MTRIKWIKPWKHNTPQHKAISVRRPELISKMFPKPCKYYILKKPLVQLWSLNWLSQWWWQFLTRSYFDQSVTERMNVDMYMCKSATGSQITDFENWITHSAKRKLFKILVTLANRLLSLLGFLTLNYHFVFVLLENNLQQLNQCSANDV